MFLFPEKEKGKKKCFSPLPGGVLLVVLAPVDVGPTRDTSHVDHVARPELLQIPLDGGPVLQPCPGDVDLLALLLEKLDQKPTQPAVSTKDQESLRLSCVPRPW